MEYQRLKNPAKTGYLHSYPVKKWFKQRRLVFDANESFLYRMHQNGQAQPLVAVGSDQQLSQPQSQPQQQNQPLNENSNSMDSMPIPISNVTLNSATNGKQSQSGNVSFGSSNDEHETNMTNNTNNDLLPIAANNNSSNVTSSSNQNQKNQTTQQLNTNFSIDDSFDNFDSFNDIIDNDSANDNDYEDSGSKKRRRKVKSEYYTSTQLKKLNFKFIFENQSYRQDFKSFS